MIITERIFNFKCFTNKYEKKNFPTQKRLEKVLNIKSITLNVLYAPYNSEEIRHACKSKYNLNRNVIHLKQALDHGLILKKVHKVIQFKKKHV